MSKQGSLFFQAKNELQSMIAFGESKHRDKALGATSDRIYSINTFKTYVKHIKGFTDYCKKEYSCKTVEDCKKYVKDYMNTRKDLSPYTQKLELAALAKLYKCKSTDFGVSTPARTRDVISRSRNDVVRDKHFSEEKNQKLVDFCRGTGLRRSELEALKQRHLIIQDGKLYISVIGGKGGKDRLVPVREEYYQVVRDAFAEAKDHKDTRVFEKVHGGADIHSYRRDYADGLYVKYARPFEECKNSKFVDSKGKEYKNSVYWRRNTIDGERKWLDKKAMQIVTLALGHNRISVFGEHYGS